MSPDAKRRVALVIGLDLHCVVGCGALWWN
jgi:hypothetical protein